MKSHPLSVFFLTLLVSVSMLFPMDLVAQAQAARGAGKISRMIPNVNVQRGPRVQTASTAMQVLWGDTLTTDRGGRARVTLNDGSILNVGSESSLRVVSHDSANQRTQLQLAYGRLRSSAVRLARAGAEFEVRTPTAVAGVVGTDFFLEHVNNISRLITYEGRVRFCNLKGICVIVLPGMTSAIRPNEEPSSPVNVSPAESMTASNSTGVGGGAAGAGGAGAAGAGGALAGHSMLLAVGLVAAAVVPAAVVPAVKKSNKCACPTVVTAHP